MARLLAIVSVGRERRVRCRAPGCKRTVYAQIHAVETDEGTSKKDTHKSNNWGQE